ncbi:hypothetical protein F4775DRAFT_562348 [Biscogniauxia sp. FL1348]|nr:hypothetical protein F4775DRAFT_562348 [Biscogniauxia sp. FL1348]
MSSEKAKETAAAAAATGDDAASTSVPVLQNADSSSGSADRSKLSASTAPADTFNGTRHTDSASSASSKSDKRSRRKRMRRHCARFWLWYLISVIIFLAIFLPLLFTKIIPAIAQDIVNKAQLPVYGGSLRALSPNTLSIGLQTSLTVPSGLHVQLDPTELWLYNKESPGFVPYSMVPLGGQSLTGTTAITVEDEAEVLNATGIEMFLSKFLASDSVDFSFKGNTTARLGAIKSHINMAKSLTIPGLRNLTGLSIDSANFVLPPAEDGSNLVGNLTLPNWSSLELGFGNITFNIWSGDILVAKASVFDVLLQPGNTTLPFRGEVFVETVLDNFIEVLRSQSGILGSGKIALGITGNETTINGQHVMYVENVLNRARLSSELPFLQLVTDIFGSVLNGNTSLSGIGDILKNATGGVNSTGDNPLSDLLGGLNITGSAATSLQEAAERLRSRELDERT